MKWVRTAIEQMTGYVPGEQPTSGRLIKLNTNENPYPPSPRVVEAIREASGEDLRLYPDGLATELREAAAKRYGLKTEQVLAGNGSDELLAMITRVALGPGDPVCYPTPTYTLYDTLVSIQEGLTIKLPFGPDFALPEGIAAAGAKLTFICNPNSPSGTWASIDEIERLVSVIQGLVVIDEAYVDFAPASALPLVARHANLIVLRSFSKSFSLAGMRLGLAFACEEIIATLAKVKDSYNVGRLPIVAGVQALRDYEWMERNVAKVRTARGLLAEGLRQLGFETLPSHANFVMARKRGEDQEWLARRLRQQGILVRYFPVAGLRDAVRVTVGADYEIKRLLAALKELSSARV